MQFVARFGRGLGRLASGNATSSTLTRLRWFQALSVVLGLVLALAGGYGVGRRSSSLAEARTAAQQLIAVQDVRVAVVRADAIASSSYLVGGEEDPAQRTAYLAEVDRASNGMVAVANRVGGADAALLAEGSRLLSSYVGLVEQARANNRQGFQVGAAYQRQANAIVVNDQIGDDGTAVPNIVATLRAVEDSQRRQVNDRLAEAHRAGAWLQLVGWVLFGVLALGAVWMALRFRRWVNVPVGLAALGVLVLLVAGGTAQSAAVNDADTAVDGPLLQADITAQARAAGFDARSQEALTLINRGSGQANEAKWKVSAAIVDDIVGRCACDPDRSFAAYEAGHDELRALDDGGDWDTAVATSLGQAGTVATSFESFADATASVVDDASRRADQQLVDARSSLASLRLFVIVVGLLAAVLAAVGFGQRIREYR